LSSTRARKNKQSFSSSQKLVRIGTFQGVKKVSPPETIDIFASQETSKETTIWVVLEGTTAKVKVAMDLT